MQTQQMDYWKLFKPSACSVKLGGTTQEEVFEELTSNLVKAKQLPSKLASAAQEAMIERERLASTGVGQNVAIPHIKLSGLEKVVVSLSVHNDGVEWSSLDGSLVHLFFTVLRPARPSEKFDPDRHLDMMRWISQLGRDGDFRNFARAASNRTELVDLLKEMAGA